MSGKRAWGGNSRVTGWKKIHIEALETAGCGGRVLVRGNTERKH